MMIGQLLQKLQPMLDFQDGGGRQFGFVKTQDIPFRENSVLVYGDDHKTRVIYCEQIVDKGSPLTKTQRFSNQRRWSGLCA